MNEMTDRDDMARGRGGKKRRGEEDENEEIPGMGD